MTTSGIPPEFIMRVGEEKLFSLEEIKKAIKYSGIPNLKRYEIMSLSDIVQRKQFSLEHKIKLLRLYLPQSEGPKVVVDALLMLQQWTKETCEIGINALEILIGNVVLERGLDFEMANIAYHCLKDDDGSGIYRILTSFSNYPAQKPNAIIKLKKTASVIAEIAPINYLNAASPDPDGSTGFGFGCPPFSFYPLSKISAKTLVKWCLVNNERWKRILPKLEIFILDETKDEGNNTKEKLSPLISEILNTVPNPDIVIRIIIEHVKGNPTERPIYGNDTFRAACERRLKILKELKDHARQEVRNTILNSKI